jgi:glycosyltransferase involved in cell wall biosynthesis
MRDRAFYERLIAESKGEVSPAVRKPPCPGCQKKKQAWMQDAKDKSLISVVIPVLNEDPAEVALTLKTIRDGTSPPLEIIVVDDHSTPPVAGATVRNAERLGATRSRKLGCELAKGKFVVILDAHMKVEPGNLRKLCGIAAATHGIAYCGCNSHLSCELKEIGGVLESKWYRPPVGKALIQTTGLMGACYAIERATLERMGGFVGLPGPLGSQELSFAIQAAKCGVPIWCDISIQNWHHFRTESSSPFPFNLFLLNIAATYRLLFGDETWKVMRARLCANPKSGKRSVLKPDIVKQAENDAALLAYGKELRARQTMSDYDFGVQFKLDFPEGAAL